MPAGPDDRPLHGTFQEEHPLPPLAVRLRSAVTLVGGFPALSGVDLDVAEGEVVLLTGPNGAGKTTLLRLLAGLAPLSSGTGTVFGHDLGGDRREVRRSVALLGHETFCYDDLTAAENLTFHARAAGGSREEAAAVLGQVGLARQAGVTHRLLSAGQRRRLALGVALVRDAPLLLLDEPHAGLDAAGRAVLERAVRAASAAGRTVVIASHEVERARPLATREVAMAGGHAAGAAERALPSPEAGAEPEVLVAP